jgi:hypothetical protein
MCMTASSCTSLDCSGLIKCAEQSCSSQCPGLSSGPATSSASGAGSSSGASSSGASNGGSSSGSSDGGAPTCATVTKCNGCFLLGTYESYRTGPCMTALTTQDENACVLILEELQNVGLCKPAGCTSTNCQGDAG